MYGRDYGLLRDVRKEYARVQFGRERVGYVCLQGNFDALEKIGISFQKENP